MAETIEQMVERLAKEACAFRSNILIDEMWVFSASEMTAFARACMLEQAKRDAEICRSWKLLPHTSRATVEKTRFELTAQECADAIIKEAEGMK